MNNEIIEMTEITPSAPPPMAPQNEKLTNHWSDGSTSLLAKWERICAHRKKAHYSASNDYGWKNKFLSIPIIVISTILGSLSFIHPSFIDRTTCSRRLSFRNLQTECVCNSYLNGASSNDDNLCMKIGTTQCYPPNSGDGLCPGDMLACTNIDVPTEAPTTELDGYVPELDNGPNDCCTHTAPWDDQFTLMCQTCAYDAVVNGQSGITYKWYQNGVVQFQLTCATGWGAMAGKAFCSGQNNQNGGTPSYMATCQSQCDTNSPTFNPTFNPTTTPTFSPTTATPTTAGPTTAPTFFPTPIDCANNCCISGPDMWRSDASPTIPGWTVESPYLDHTNGGLWKKNQCEDMCRADSQCNSWMWRNSASSCYLSTYVELKEYRPNPGYNDHHPHKFSRGCTDTPTFSPTKTPTTSPTISCFNVDSEHIGKRPYYSDGNTGCFKANINQESSSNYYFKTLNTCKKLCKDSDNCNVISRFSGKEDTQEWHCYFYYCTDLSDINWIDQTSWGNGASNSEPYKLLCPTDQEEVNEPEDGDCSDFCGGEWGVCPNIGNSLGMWDCQCCYQYWRSCSFSYCDDWCYPNCDSSLAPTKTPTTVAPSSPAERCENYCQNSCAQFGTPEDNVSECQGCDSSKACHPGASNYNSLEAWCAFYACDSVNSRCDNWRCVQSSNTPTTTKTPTTTPTTSPSPPFEGKSGKSGDSEGDGDGEECAPGCHDDWPGDGVCDDSCFNSACNYDDGDCATPTPTNLPTSGPTTYSPTRQPTPTPSTKPSALPTESPSTQPTRQPTQEISYMQGGASARSTEEDNKSGVIFPYIIGAFNMMIAILSALHTFLKYDALEDRHHQYSRHFANLQVDLETLLAKPIEQRGDVGTMVERYKTKYAVLINNAPDLSERLERRCCGGEQIIPTTCDTPRKISGYSFSD